jgi:hypothetical protein
VSPREPKFTVHFHTRGHLLPFAFCLEKKKINIHLLKLKISLFLKETPLPFKSLRLLACNLLPIFSESSLSYNNRV